MKDELDKQIMKKVVGLRAKTYSCLKDNNDEDKKAKGKKKVCHKKKTWILRLWNCLAAAQTERKKTYLREK